MPKRSATSSSSSPSPKKAKSAASATAATTTEEKKNEPAEMAMNQWRVVLTGDFVIKDKAVLEHVLKEKGAAVTSAVSGKTTHLILGKSGVNEFGKRTGIGSSKYNQALEKKLPIISEKEIWAILQGSITATELESKKEAQMVTKKPNQKGSTLAEKILYAMQEATKGKPSAGEKVSLPRLKKELEEQFGMNFDSTRNKNNLKKVLASLVEDNALKQSGASYMIPDVELPHPQQEQEETDSHPAAATTTTYSKAETEIAIAARIQKECPEQGRWRGLRVISAKPRTSKSGRAQCKGCDTIIAKGELQVQVCDDSLFKMVTHPNDCHEGMTRGYTEENFGQGYTISRRQFWIHEHCHPAAEEKYQTMFQNEWTKLRPQVIAQWSQQWEEEYK